MSHKGKSIELAQLFAEKIRSGEWKSGERLQSIHRLASEYNTAVATISKVMEILDNKGLVERINGRGVFVKEKKNLKVVLVFDNNSELGTNAHKSSFLRVFLTKCREENITCTIFENVDHAADCVRVRKYLTENACDAILISSGYFAIHNKKYLKNIPILVIGCYAYKWVDLYLRSEVWLEDAINYLLEQGCDKIAMFDHEEDAEHWLHLNEKSIKDIYLDLAGKYPDKISESLYKRTKLSPKDSYRLACELFNENKECKRLGIISHDAIFTYGIISAIFRNEKNLWEDVFVVSHANKGAYLSEFPIPLITYSSVIAKECDLIFELLQEYQKTKKHPQGRKILPVEFYTPLA